MSVEVQYGELYDKRYFTSIDDSMLDQFLVFHEMDINVKAAARAYFAYYKTHPMEQIAVIAGAESVDELEMLLKEADKEFNSMLEADKQRVEAKQTRDSRSGKLRRVGETASRLYAAPDPSPVAPNSPARKATGRKVAPVRADSLILESLPENAKGACEDLPIDERDKFTGKLIEKEYAAQTYCTNCLAQRVCLDRALEQPDPRNAGVFVGLHGTTLERYLESQKNVLALERERYTSNT